MSTPNDPSQPSPWEPPAEGGAQQPPPVPPSGAPPPSGQPPYGAPYGQQPYGQQPYGQPPYGQPPYGYPGRSGRINGMAIASLICAFLCTPLGLIFGAVALSQINRTGERGRGLAIAGIVISALSIVIAITLLATAGSTTHATVG